MTITVICWGFAQQHYTLQWLFRVIVQDSVSDCSGHVGALHDCSGTLIVLCSSVKLCDSSVSVLRSYDYIQLPWCPLGSGDCHVTVTSLSCDQPWFCELSKTVSVYDWWHLKFRNTKCSDKIILHRSTYLYTCFINSNDWTDIVWQTI